MKIYKISSPQTDDVYIGKTTQTLKIRFRNHKSGYKQYCYEKRRFCFSFLVVCYEDSKIDLIEETDDETRERYWIRKLDCCNNRMNRKPVDYICKIKSNTHKRGFTWFFHYSEDNKFLVRKKSVDKDFLITFANNWFVEQGIDL